MAANTPNFPPVVNQEVYVEMNTFFAATLFLAAQNFHLLNSTVVFGKVVSVDIFLAVAVVCFPAMLKSYRLPFAWFQNQFVYSHIPPNKEQLTVDDYLSAFHPRTNIGDKLEKVFLEESMLQSHGCAVLEEPIPFTGKITAKNAKKAVASFLLDTSSPGLTAGQKNYEHWKSYKLLI